MGLAKTKTVLTLEDYLRIDRTEDERYEFFDGEIYAMADESGEHGDICMNISRLIGNDLVGTDYGLRIKDTKVRI